jgi:hypothetical protein
MADKIEQEHGRVITMAYGGCFVCTYDRGVREGYATTIATCGKVMKGHFKNGQ